jgi:hypothetical protein
MELKMIVQKPPEIKKLMAEYFLFPTALNLAVSRAKWVQELFICRLLPPQFPAKNTPSFLVFHLFHD